MGARVWRSGLVAALLGCSAWIGAAGPAQAAEQVVKIGNILALTGAGAAIAQHVQQAQNLYMKLHANALPPGTRVELITRDDASKPDNTRRIAQELIVRDHVQMISGIVLSPQGFSIAPVLTEAKVPAILMNATTGSITRASPYIVRFSHSNWQMAYTLGVWAAQHDIKTAYTMVADYAAGLDMEAAFKRGFTDHGGKILGSDRTPLSTTDYLPYMDRVKAAKPQVVFLFEIAGTATIAWFKAYAESGLREAGVLPVGSGDVVPDDELPETGAEALGMVDASIYSTAVKSAANDSFIAAWKKEYGADSVPSFESVAAWNGMAAIYQAVAKLGDKATGDAAMAVLSHFSDPNSPEGPVSIDPETRDIIHNIYLCRVVKTPEGYVNQPFDTVASVKDPWKILNPK